MENAQTRLPFRVLAAWIGLFLLCVGMPAALIGAQPGVWERSVLVACCFVGGLGLLIGSYTGRWFNSSA